MYDLSDFIQIISFFYVDYIQNIKNMLQFLNESLFLIVFSGVEFILF